MISAGPSAMMLSCLSSLTAAPSLHRAAARSAKPILVKPAARRVDLREAHRKPLPSIQCGEENIRVLIYHQRSVSSLSRRDKPQPVVPLVGVERFLFVAGLDALPSRVQPDLVQVYGFGIRRVEFAVRDSSSG